MLGMSNILDEQMVGHYLEADIDNYAFVTPEPLAVMLLTVASVPVLRRRRMR